MTDGFNFGSVLEFLQTGPNYLNITYLPENRDNYRNMPVYKINFNIYYSCIEYELIKKLADKYDW